MNCELLKRQVASSPAYVFERNVMLSSLEKLDEIRRQTGCKVLYSIKSLPLVPVLRWLVPYVDGFDYRHFAGTQTIPRLELSK
ncbi:MAG: hypothetical protein ACU85E_13155, partial [Gammaproteobacteria bacterium]